MIEDPIRLVDESDSELLKSLLGAAREERPQQAALRRTLTAIGIGSGVIAATSAASAAGVGSGALGASGALNAQALGSAASLGSSTGLPSSTLLVVVKWLGAGVVAGMMATSVIYAVGAPPLPAPSADRPAAAKAIAPVRNGKPPSSAGQVPDTAAEVHVQSEVPTAPTPSAVFAPLTAPVASVEPPVSVPAKVDPAAPLAAELALLDSARQALAAGNADSALRTLNDYDTRFAQPNLAPEALYLRLESLTLKGDKAGTEAVARRLLAAYPSGPHAARARAVLSR